MLIDLSLSLLRLRLKPAAASGLGPSSVRGYGEPARRTGRVLPSPDPDSARCDYDWSSITQDLDSISDAEYDS